MAPTSVTVRLSSAKAGIKWRPTKIMNMLDLSKDDDFLSHLLVEKLGTGVVPLLVHKMDSSRRLPKTDAENLLQIVRRNVVTKSTVQHATRQAVDELLVLPPIRYYLRSYTQKQINAFATHASRYFELYHPSGSIEIAHTSRYSHRTGKSELCILATRSLAPAAVITELKGSMANLTDEEDKELKRTDLRNSDIRRDFSVIHSKQMKKNHLFLGPARFVNHDCNNNCELFREGRYITFRVLRSISIGEEITAHYGDGYFGRNNRHCLCETCEKAGRGGYAQDASDDDVHSTSESDSDSDSTSGSSSSESDEGGQPSTKQKAALNINERRTRRGVYAILQEEDGDSDESDDEENFSPLTDAEELLLAGDPGITIEANQSTPLESIISTRRQKAAAVTDEDIGTTTSPIKRIQEEDGDSDESDDEEHFSPLTEVQERLLDGTFDLGIQAEAETASDLTPLPSSRSSSNPSTSALDPGLMTPDPDSVRPIPMSSSSDRSNAKSNQSTPFKSIISTRRQKAAAATDEDIGTTINPIKRIQQLVTPPLSEDTASLVDSSSSRRVTRSSLAPAGTPPLNKGKGREKAFTPSTALSTPSKDKGNQEGKTKTKEESEARVLRTRPSLLPMPADEAKAVITKPEKPRGPDGKLLPICVTCSNVLPVISVDLEVVWGLISPRGKGKKKEKQDCPRCMRHFAIYAQPWPSRMPAHGTAFLPTPREDSSPAESATKRVTQKTLPALDRKLAAAASASSKSRAHENVDERPTKKRKTESGPRVDMSAKAKRALLGSGKTRSGRHSHPSTKIQDAGPQKRKRGRPRLTSPTPKLDQATGDKSLKLKSLAVQNQPRDSNGRFGKKGSSNGRFTRKKFTVTVVGSGTLSRAQRAIERGKVKTWLERKDESEMEKADDNGPARISSRRVTRKRSGDNLEELPSKRTRGDRGDGVENQEQRRPSKSGDPSTFPFGRLATSYKSVGLFRAPNPMSFARRTWGTTEIQEATDGGVDKDPKDDSPLTSGDESDPPVTPDDHTPSLATTEPNGTLQRRHGGLTDSEANDVDADHLVAVPSSKKPSGPHPVAFTFKPSPFNFARRRWASMSTSPDGSSVPPVAGSTSLPNSADRNGAIDAEDLFETGSSRGFWASALSRDGVFTSRWLGDDSSSGEEDVIIPESPDPSRFVLQHRASFGPESQSAKGRMNATSDSSSEDLSDEPCTTSLYV